MLAVFDFILTLIGALVVVAAVILLVLAALAPEEPDGNDE